MAFDPAHRKLIGMLTPSSNTVLEPATAAMLAGLPEASAHFGRFRVTEIALDPAALKQFDEAPILEAARLLADARVGAVVWNGTSSGWLGLEADRRLCAAIHSATGIAAGTSVLALVEILRRQGARKIGLVSPYLDGIQARIVENFQREGFETVAERHLGDRGNFSFSEVGEDRIAALVREVAKARPDAISVFCTNMRGAAVAPWLEKELGIPVYDTVATAVWAGLRLVGVPPKRVVGWGSLFANFGD